MSLKIKTQFEFEDAIKSIEQLRKSLETALNSVDGKPVTKEMNDAVKSIEKFLARTEDLGSTVNQTYKDMLDNYKRIKQAKADSDDLIQKQIQHETQLEQLEEKRRDVVAQIAKKRQEYQQQGKSIQKASDLANAYVPSGDTRSLGIQSASLDNKVVDEKNKIRGIGDQISSLNEDIREGEASIEAGISSLRSYSAYLETSKESMKQIDASWGDIVARNTEATKALEEQARLAQAQADAQKQADIDATSAQTSEGQLSEWKQLQQQIEANTEEINAYERALGVLQEAGHNALDVSPVIEHLTALQEENAELAKMQDNLTDISISSIFDKSDISGTSDRLRAHIQNIVDSVDGVDLSSNLQRIVDKLESVSSRAEQATSDMKMLESFGKEDSLEYQNLETKAISLNNQMRIYIEKWNEAIAKMKEANATPTPTPGGTGEGGAVENAGVLKDEYTAANRALMSLTTSTRSLGLLIPGINTRAIRGVTMLTRATLRLSSMTKGQLTTAIQGVGKALSTVLKSLMAHPIVLAIAAVIAALVALKKLVDQTKKEVEAMGKAFVQGLGKAGKSIGKLTLEMGKGFLLLGTGVMKSVLNGITAVFNKIKSLKSVITENIKLMAQWRGGNNALNVSMSNLTSSLAYLKAAFSSAFVPVITVIEPALTRLMNKLAEVMTMIGMFIAKISGASTFQKAIRVQKDYAKALNGTGSAAKKTLASFDELNILNGNSGSGEAVNWEEVEMAKVEIPDLIAKMRELGSEVGTKIRDALNGIPWDAVKSGADYATSAISAFINALFDVTGLGKAVGNALAELGNTFVLFVNGLLTKIDFGRIGEQLGQGFQKFLDVFEFDKLGQVFSNSLNTLSTLLFNFFSNFNGADLGKGLTAWFQNAFGRIDWTTIRATVIAGMEDITGFLNEVITPENFSTLAKSISEAFNSLFLGIQQFAEGVDWEQWGESIATGINDLFKSFNPKQAGQAINNLAHGLLDMILTAIKDINWDDVSNAIVEFISNIDWEGLGAKAKEISTQLMDALKKIWAALADSEAFDQIIDLIAEFLAEKKNWEKAFKKIRNEVVREVVFAKIREFFEGIGEKIMELFSQEMTGGTDDEKSHGMGYNIGKNILEGILSGIAGTPASGAFSILFDNIWNGICQIFGIHSPAKSMEPVGENVVNGILEGFNLVDVASALSEWWDDNIAPWFSLEKWKSVGETVRVALATKMDEIKTNLTTKWDNLTSSLTEKLEILKEIFSLKFEAIKTKVVDAFTAIKDGIKTPINGIISLVESMVNLVINGINGLVDKVNSVSFDLTNPITGKNYTFDVNIPKLSTVAIPRLAQGAVLPPNAPFLAMLGDQKNGKNVEAPLDTIKQALAETLQGMSLNGTGGEVQPINIYLGTDLIYSEIKKLEKRNAIIGG